jgi:hypothetical protein
MNTPGGKIESIQNLITELYTKLLLDQKHSDKDWYERERFLNNTIYDTNALILRLSEQIAAGQKKLALTNSKIARAEKNVKEYSTQYTQERAMVVNLQIKRNMDHAIYKDNVYNNQNLLLALDQVMIALRKLRGSLAGLDRPSHVREGRSESRDRSWKKEHGSALMQIFSEDDIASFIMVATEADQDGLAKLLDLLEKLKRSAEKSLIDFDQDEKDSLKAYNFLHQKLRFDIEKLEGIIRRQERNLKAYISYRNSLIVEINEKTNLRKKNQEFLNQTVETRRVESLRYEADKRARNREKLIIKKLEKIVNEKLAKMNAFVRGSVNQ